MVPLLEVHRQIGLLEDKGLCRPILKEARIVNIMLFLGPGCYQLRVGDTAILPKTANILSFVQGCVEATINLSFTSLESNFDATIS